MKRLEQLTFTRFIAVLTVLFFHGLGGVYLQYALYVFPFPAVVSSAETSVTYLYALSGFVMALAYFRPQEEFHFAKYWRARFVRIYPLFAVSLLLVCYYYLDGVARIKPQKIIANIFAAQAWIPAYAQSFNFPAWSLTVEFFFYAVFPFFALWAYKRTTKKILWLAFAFWAFSQSLHFFLWRDYFADYKGFLVDFSDYENFLIYFPFFHLSAFLLGAAGGVWYLRDGRAREPKPFVVLTVLASSVALICAYVIVAADSARLPHGAELMTGLLAPISTVIIVALAMDRTRFSAFFHRPLFIVLGEMAYPLYILHIPVKWIYQRALENSALANPSLVFDYTYLPLLLAISWGAYAYVDPLLQRGLKWILQRISAPLFLLNIGILSLSVYASFALRFDNGREYAAYGVTIRLMFWAAFFLRSILSVALDGFNPSNLYGSFIQFVKPVLISVTAGSIAVAIVVFIAYSLGAAENFPRSIFVIDWAIVLALSLFVRFIFRLSQIYAIDYERPA